MDVRDPSLWWPHDRGEQSRTISGRSSGTTSTRDDGTADGFDDRLRVNGRACRLAVRRCATTVEDVARPLTLTRISSGFEHRERRQKWLAPVTTTASCSGRTFPCRAPVRSTPNEDCPCSAAHCDLRTASQFRGGRCSRRARSPMLTYWASGFLDRLRSGGVLASRLRQRGRRIGGVGC